MIYNATVGNSTGVSNSNMVSTVIYTLVLGETPRLSLVTKEKILSDVDLLIKLVVYYSKLEDSVVLPVG